jgi:TonB family protein
VVVHLAVVGTVEALRDPVAPIVIPPAAAGTGPATGSEAEPIAELSTTCVGDAALAAAGRTTTCLAGVGGPLDVCLADVRATFTAERAKCAEQSDPLLAVQLVPMSPDDLARIDPEPMLEILDAADQLKHEQQQQQQVAVLEQQQQQQQQQMAKQQAQVVETAKPDTEIDPDNARFLAEYSTKVDHETVARGSRDEPMVAKSKPDSLPVKDNARDPSTKQDPTERPPGTNPDAADTPGKLSMRQPGAIVPAHAAEDEKVRGRYDGWHTPMADGFVARSGNSVIDKPRTDADDIHGGGGAGGGTPAVPNLRASDDVLERALGGGSVDHLESVDDGDETALNAKRWVYASFFNRLKRIVAQNWEPGEVWRRHDPTGSVYGFKTRITELRVSLDAKGKLASVPTVISPSGVDVLDEEAVRAFTAAAPFPNVPAGLVQSDGLITFEFSFHFEIGAPRTSWRILRQM